MVLVLFAWNRVLNLVLSWFYLSVLSELCDLLLRSQHASLNTNVRIVCNILKFLMFIIINKLLNVWDQKVFVLFAKNIFP